MAAFTTQIQNWILASEGGYVDHPSDPGGATNMGITHRTLAAWRGKPVTKQDVRNLTRVEALEIYKAQYWRTSGADRMPAARVAGPVPPRCGTSTARPRAPGSCPSFH